MLTDKISVQFFIEILCLRFRVFNVGIMLVHSSCVTVGAFSLSLLLIESPTRIQKFE